MSGCVHLRTMSARGISCIVSSIVLLLHSSSRKRSPLIGTYIKHIQGRAVPFLLAKRCRVPNCPVLIAGFLPGYGTLKGAHRLIICVIGVMVGERDHCIRFCYSFHISYSRNSITFLGARWAGQGFSPNLFHRLLLTIC